MDFWDFLRSLRFVWDFCIFLGFFDFLGILGISYGLQGFSGFSGILGIFLGFLGFWDFLETSRIFWDFGNFWDISDGKSSEGKIFFFYMSDGIRIFWIPFGDSVGFSDFFWISRIFLGFIVHLGLF